MQLGRHPHIVHAYKVERFEYDSVFLVLAQAAAQQFARMGHQAFLQQAQQLVAQLKG